MATLPVSVSEIAEVQAELELPVFPEALRSALLLQIIRSIRDKVIAVNTPDWGFDDFREYPITDLVNALTWRITQRDLEPTTINFLIIDNAFESWIESFFDGFEYMDGDVEAQMPEGLSTDDVETLVFNRDVRQALKLLKQAVELHQMELSGMES